MAEPEYLRSTRVSYDLVADRVAGAWRDELDHKPYDRAMLAAFADVIRSGGGGLVTDVGCGAGRITGWLAGAGLDVEGTDLSRGMLAAARRDYPGLRFADGDMLDLNLPEESRAGIVAWYSIIHLPRERVPDAFDGFRRALRPGGYLQLAFQAGDDDRHRTERLLAAAGSALNSDLRASVAVMRIWRNGHREKVPCARRPVFGPRLGGTVRLADSLPRRAGEGRGTYI